MMKDKMIGLLVGLLIGSTITGGLVFAGSSTTLNVVVEQLRYMVDGIEKKPTQGQGFIYQGTTYVPLRFVAEAVGKDVSWDGKNKTIWIGKKLGDFKYLVDLKYARKDALFDNYALVVANGSREIAGKEYSKILQGLVGNYHKKASFEYNIDGNFSKIEGLAGIDDSYKNATSVGAVTIIGDGRVLQTAEGLFGGDHPVELTADLRGVKKLKIQFEYRSDKDGSLAINFAEIKLY